MHAVCDFVARVPAHPEPESDVAPDISVAEQGVVLEDQSDAASMGRHRCDLVDHPGGRAPSRVAAGPR